MLSRKKDRTIRPLSQLVTEKARQISSVTQLVTENVVIHLTWYFISESDPPTVDQDLQTFLQNVNICPAKYFRWKFSRSWAFGIEGLSDFWTRCTNNAPYGRAVETFLFERRETWFWERGPASALSHTTSKRCTVICLRMCIFAIVEEAKKSRIVLCFVLYFLTLMTMYDSMMIG